MILALNDRQSTTSSYGFDTTRSARVTVKRPASVHFKVESAHGL